MEPILFVTTIINLIGYAFSIMYLLYRYTSFYNYILNFIKFSGKCINGIYYVKNYFIMNRRNEPDNEITQQTRPKLLTRIKNKIKNFFFPKKTYIELPVYETAYETNNRHDSIIRERSLFDKHITQLMDESRDNMNNTEHDVIDLQNANDENLIQYIQNTNSIYYSNTSNFSHQPNSSVFMNPYKNIFNSQNEYYTNGDTNYDTDTDDTDDSSSLLNKNSHANSNMLLNSNYIHSKLGYK